MTRLRQKYKNLKKKFEQTKTFSPTIVKINSPQVQTFKASRVIPKKMALDDGYLRQMDVLVAHDFGEKLLEVGCITRTTYDHIGDDIYQVDTNRYPFFPFGMIEFEYSLIAIMPIETWGTN